MQPGRAGKKECSRRALQAESDTVKALAEASRGLFSFRAPRGGRFERRALYSPFGTASQRPSCAERRIASSTRWFERPSAIVAALPSALPLMISANDCI